MLHPSKLLIKLVIKVHPDLEEYELDSLFNGRSSEEFTAIFNILQAPLANGTLQLQSPKDKLGGRLKKIPNSRLNNKRWNIMRPLRTEQECGSF